MVDRIEYQKESKMKPQFWTSKHMRMEVVAYAEDSETQYVILRFYDYDGNMIFERFLEDCYADELQFMVNKALKILPASK